MYLYGKKIKKNSLKSNILIICKMQKVSICILYYILAKIIKKIVINLTLNNNIIKEIYKYELCTVKK